MNLKDYLQAVKDGRAMVLAVAALVVLAGVVLAFAQPERYSSTTKLYVAAQVESEDPIELAERNEIAQQRVLSYVGVIQGNVMAEEVSQTLGFTSSPEDVEVSVEPGTVIIDITVTASNAGRAREVAEAYADAAPDAIRSLEQSGKGGWEISAAVIDKAGPGMSSTRRSPVLVIALSVVLGLGAGLTSATLWWVVRRELAAEPGPDRARGGV